MATIRTNPREWFELIDISNQEDWDNPKYKEYRTLFYGDKNLRSGNKKRGAKPNRIKVTKPNGDVTIYASKYMVADALGVSKRTIENYMNRGTGSQSPFYRWKLEPLPPLVNEYGSYINGELVHRGTMKEIAEAHNLSVSRIKAFFYDPQDRYEIEVKFIGEKEVEE